MKFEDVKNLIKLIRENDISEVEIEEPNLRIRISRNMFDRSATASRPDKPSVYSADTGASSELVAQVEKEEEKSADKYEEDRYKKVYAPLVGTLYRAPAPDAENFIKEGDVIEKGTVICIIEAMKVMNEIESEHAGRVVAIPVENATPVEYGEPICIIDPFV